MLGGIFSLVLNFTLKWCKESIGFGPYHMDYGFSFTCSAQNLCFDVNWFYALLRFNCTSKPSLTSKPLLTIALKILKTIEKPLIPMVGPSKNIQWWWSNVVKTIEKPLKSMVAWKKTLTIPSLWKIDHRHGLIMGHKVQIIISDVTILPQYLANMCPCLL